MDSLIRLVRLGRGLFATTMVAFGAQHVAHAVAGAALSPNPPWIVGGTFLSAAFGGTLIVTGTGIALGRCVSLHAAALGAVLLAYDVVFYGPGIATRIRDPSNWTRGSEILAMCGVAFVLVGVGRASPAGVRWKRLREPLAGAGRLFFAIGVFVWAAQHFIYARFTATIVPAWMPWRLFWAVLVGIVFLAASVALAFRVRPRAASLLLGVTFFFIVLLVHVPRVAATPRNGREWWSAFTAVTMLGASLAIAGARASLARGSNAPRT